MKKNWCYKPNQQKMTLMGSTISVNFAYVLRFRRE